MIKIHICDDNETELKQIKKGISYAASLTEETFDYGIISSDYHDFLNYQGSKYIPEVFFLDIDFEEMAMNGLQLAVTIRKNNPHAFICFVTTHAEMSYLTFKYKVMAFDFIIKDNFEAMLSSFVECLQAIIQQVACREDEEDFLELKVHHETKKISVPSIIVCETIGNHKIRLIGEQQVFNLSKTISDMKRMLPDYFVQVHRSYLVNTKKISSYEQRSGKITLSNDMEIFVPYRKKGILYNILMKK